MKFLLSIDDTDSLDSGGTGRLALQIVDTPGQGYPVQEVIQQKINGRRMRGRESQGHVLLRC